ncbi:MAG: hypothetical protein LLF95_10030 [Bacteroidales bacterium]|nr:hypothetical protein [Bacteroidales bacterium]
MKNILKVIFFAVIASFTSCNESSLDDLTGKYPPPTDYAFTNLFAQQVQKLKGKRIFTLKIATNSVAATFNEQTGSYTYTGSGNYISIDFVGKTYFLETGAYTIAANETAKAGNYIAGYDTEMFGVQFTNRGTCFFDVTNGTETGAKVTAGTLNVTKNGDNYTISGVLAMNNGKFIRINYSGVVIFPEDQPVYTYSVEVSSPYAWTADGTTWNPVAGSQLSKITVKSDGAAVAYFEIVTAVNPSSLSGTYPVSGMITDANGSVVQGMYVDLSAYVPGLIIESGSYLLDDDTKQYISSGNLTVVDNGGVLTFTSNNFSVTVLGVPVGGTKSVSYINAAKEGVSSGG